MKSGVLNSWKEVAAYLHCGLRTAQRWESELALPIHRPHDRRGPVVAFPEELDKWLRRRSLYREIKQNGVDSAALVILKRVCPELAADLMLLCRGLALHLDVNPAGTTQLVELIRDIVKQLMEVIEGNEKKGSIWSSALRVSSSVLATSDKQDK